MWKKFKDKEYYLQFKQGYMYEICITDFISVWTTAFSEKAFIAQLKDSNEGLSLENDNEYINNGLKILLTQFDEVKQNKVEVNGDNLLITMRMVMGYPFSFKCRLVKGSNELFFKKVTQPLLKTISESRVSQNEIKQILLKKDKEIKAYIRELQNKKIIFPHEETKVFDESEHMNKYKLYEENFGTLDIPNTLLEKKVEVQQNHVRREPIPASIEQINIKQELESIKQETHPPIFEEPSSFIQTIKQEVTKTERLSSQTRVNDRRKKLKLNY